MREEFDHYAQVAADNATHPENDRLVIIVGAFSNASKKKPTGQQRQEATPNNATYYPDSHLLKICHMSPCRWLHVFLAARLEDFAHQAFGDVVEQGHLA